MDRRRTIIARREVEMGAHHAHLEIDVRVLNPPIQSNLAHTSVGEAQQIRLQRREPVLRLLFHIPRMHAKRWLHPRVLGRERRDLLPVLDARTSNHGPLQADSRHHRDDGLALSVESIILEVVVRVVEPHADSSAAQRPPQGRACAFQIVPGA